MNNDDVILSLGKATKKLDEFANDDSRVHPIFSSKETKGLKCLRELVVLLKDRQDSICAELEKLKGGEVESQVEKGEEIKWIDVYKLREDWECEQVKKFAKPIVYFLGMHISKCSERGLGHHKRWEVEFEKGRLTFYFGEPRFQLDYEDKTYEAETVEEMLDKIKERR